MPRGTWSITRDLSLRAAGLLALVVAALAARHLFQMVRVAPGQTVSVTELGIAAVAFVGASAGSALLLLGAHLADEVEISARWVRRPVERRAPPA